MSTTPVEPDDAESNDTESNDTESNDAEPDDAEPDDAEPDDAESDDAESADAESDDAESDDAGKPTLRYVVTAVCSFDFVSGSTPRQEVEIPKLLAKALTDAVEGYTTRNTSATTVEFVSVSEL